MDEARGVTPAPTKRQEAGKKKKRKQVRRSVKVLIKGEFSNEEIDAF